MELYKLRQYNEKFLKIFREEQRISKQKWGNDWEYQDPKIIAGTSLRMGEIAQSSYVSRSYNKIYGITTEDFAFESVAAHTNLMEAIVSNYLRQHNSLRIKLENKGYSKYEIDEAILLHDLPENDIGDIPDNGIVDEEEKEAKEQIYYNVLGDTYSLKEASFKDRANKLLYQMKYKYTEIGKILYCADKISAILMTLQYDLNDRPPLKGFDDDSNSERDLKEMKLCDKMTIDGKFYASEMWTIDWFKARELIQYDHSGFFTALIIMRTLQVNNRWYTWREKDYKNN